MIRYKGFRLERDNEEDYLFFMFKDTDNKYYKQVVRTERDFKDLVDMHLKMRLDLLQKQFKWLSTQLEYLSSNMKLNLNLLNKVEGEEFLHLEYD